MGMTLGKPFAGLFQENNESRIIVLFGLDGAGKSSILHKLKTGEKLLTTMPTVGINVESVKYKNASFCIWDIGGQHRYRTIPLSKHYFQYQEVSGLVCVIDSMDRERIEEAKDFLNLVIDEENIPDNVAVLVYGNKCEVPGAMSASEISDKLDLTSLRQRKWQRNVHVQSSCAFSGDGIHEGFDWLLKNIGRM